jgi:hypothetical protein
VTPDPDAALGAVETRQAGEPAPGARRRSANRPMLVPALVMVLIGTVLMLLRVTAGAVACLALAAVLLLGGFRGNRSE